MNIVPLNTDSVSRNSGFDIEDRAGDVLRAMCLNEWDRTETILRQCLIGSQAEQRATELLNTITSSHFTVAEVSGPRASAQISILPFKRLANLVKSLLSDASTSDTFSDSLQNTPGTQLEPGGIGFGLPTPLTPEQVAAIYAAQQQPLMAQTSRSHVTQNVSESLPIIAPMAPLALFCPTGKRLFVDPVLCKNGLVYERSHADASSIVVPCRTMRIVADVWRRHQFEKLPIFKRRLTETISCPITKGILEVPATAADGVAYEFESIKLFLQRARPLSPVLHTALMNKKLTQNKSVQELIRQLHQAELIDEDIL